MDTVSPFDGPHSLSRAERTRFLDRIIAALQQRYEQEMAVMALYGSMARETDGPYSDIELICVLTREDETDFTHEWVFGPGKAEVNIMSRTVALADASSVDEEWPLWYGQYRHARLLDGDPVLLEELRTAADNLPDEPFHDAIREILVGELYERMGKLRNAMDAGRHGGIPRLACDCALQGALLLGLLHRHVYGSGMGVLNEALRLDNRPDGYDILCRLVMAGKLGDPESVNQVLETFWSGLARWSQSNGIDLRSRLHWPF